MITSNRFNLGPDGDEQKYERRETNNQVSFDLGIAGYLPLIASDLSTYFLMERNGNTEGEKQVTRQKKLAKPGPCRLRTSGWSGLTG